MLDSVLAENVMAVHRQKRSGVLTAVGLSTSMRVAFQDGNPTAIDLGNDKDTLLAGILLSCHRITYDQYQHLVAAVGQGNSVTSIVTHQGWATADELGRSLQAVVEDSLITFFGSRIQSVSFVDGAEADFDYDQTAVRLRIAADVLLRTTSARIDEQRLLLSEFDDFQGVYAFDEDAHRTGELTDAERRFLDLVDGRMTLSQMANQLRESNITIGRLAHGLLAKRVIRRVGGSPSSTQLASATTSAMTSPISGPPPVRAHESALRAATPTLNNFEPHRRIAEEPRSKALLIVLSLVLAVLALVGVAVLNYHERQKELELVLNQFNDLLNRSEWAQAQERIEEASTKAGNDLQAQRRVDDLKVLFKTALKSEGHAIRGLISAYDFATANRRMNRLPPEADGVSTLRNELRSAESGFQERSEALAATMEKTLGQSGPAAAVILIKEYGGHAKERVAAQEVLERWRITKLEAAESPGAPLVQRTQALDLALTADPSARQLEKATLIRADIQRQQERLQEQILIISGRIDAGDVDGSLAEVDRLRLRELVAGSALESELAGIIGRTDAVRTATAAYRERLAKALMLFDGGKDLHAAIQEGSIKIESLGSQGTGTIKSLIEFAREIHATVGIGSPDAQAAQLSGLLATRDLGNDLSVALTARIERLKTLEVGALSQLDNARALIRDGLYTPAEEILKDLISRKDLQGSAARSAADQELADLSGKIAKRKALQDQLKTVLAQGDVAAGTILAREMGLKYLPLSIDSVPTGADVWHGEEHLGITPMILDITAADRVDYQLSLRLAGYVTATVSGAQAEAGWRLMVPLDRAPSQVLELGMPVTIPPLALNGGFITGSRSHLLRIPAEGPWTTTPLGEVSVEDPIYAPPFIDGATLILPTRNLVGIVEDAAGIRRIPLPVSSDLPVAIHRSAVVVDRSLIIVAGLDGTLAASDLRDQHLLWRTPTGAPFVTGPMLLEDRVMIARRDGHVAMLTGDDGIELATANLEEPIVAAWVSANGIAGVSSSTFFAWDGQTLTRDRLPTPALSAGKGVIVTTGQRVLVRQGDAWNDVGRVDGRPTALPIVWNQHAVVVMGREVRILGARGFSLTSPQEFLAPLIWKDRLVLISQDGRVRVYDP